VTLAAFFMHKQHNSNVVLWLASRCQSKRMTDVQIWQYRRSLFYQSVPVVVRDWETRLFTAHSSWSPKRL